MAQPPSRNEKWIRRFQPSPDAAVRLVCLPHAGGSASFFFSTARALAPAVDVLAVQYPGRQDRRDEPCLESLPKLADLITEEILPWADRPLALFGHSMGATLAYEIAHRLEDRQTVPAALFVSGRNAPDRTRQENLHLLDDDQLVKELAKIDGTDPSILADEEIMRMSLGPIRGDYRALAAYRWEPREPLHIPLHAHIGDADSKVSSEGAQAWQDHTTGPFTLTTYTGGHFYLNDHAPQLLESISTSLTRAPQQR